MANACEQCGKGPTSGNNVSHSRRHTKRRFKPNLITKKFLDANSGNKIKVKMCAKCLKTLSKAK